MGGVSAPSFFPRAFKPQPKEVRVIWPLILNHVSLLCCRWKASGEQFDDRVVEVVWDWSRSTWKFMRFRDDKYEGNYKTVVTSIIKSIQHGVEAEQLVAHAGFIRKAWKARQAQKAEQAKRDAAAERARREGVPGVNGAYEQGQQQAVQGSGGYGGAARPPPPPPPSHAGGPPPPPASAMMGLKR